jgi:prepilin-type N-terminal cleavage/methylation domain-containing protein
MRQSSYGFTLAEMLVSIGVLSLLILSIARLVNDAATLVSSASRRSEADNQSRQLLDRIAIDLNRMPRRADLDYYLKAPANPQPGNDQLAFYSEVPGYYPSSGSQSPISLVAYRVNAQKQAERLGKGLLWNGVSSTNAPMVFLPRTIVTIWPGGTNAASDIDYEIAATNVLRFEYYYWLTNGTVSAVPWDANAGHIAVDGMRDVAGICIVIATMDSKSRGFFSDAEVTALAGRMSDFGNSGELLSQWQAAVTTSDELPRPAITGIRICRRCFELPWKR